MEEDLKRLKHDRVDNIQKLKKELKNKEMETIQKNTEIQVLGVKRNNVYFFNWSIYS